MQIDRAQDFVDMDLVSRVVVQRLGNGQYRLLFELERELPNMSRYLETRRGEERRFKTLDAVASALDDLGVSDATLKLDAEA